MFCFCSKILSTYSMKQRKYKKNKKNKLKERKKLKNTEKENFMPHLKVLFNENVRQSSKVGKNTLQFKYLKIF